MQDKTYDVEPTTPIVGVFSLHPPRCCSFFGENDYVWTCAPVSPHPTNLVDETALVQPQTSAPLSRRPRFDFLSPLPPAATVPNCRYGDISPSTPLSRLLISGLILSLFFCAPLVTNALVNLTRMTPKHGGSLSKRRGMGHIVVSRRAHLQRSTWYGLSHDTVHLLYVCQASQRSLRKTKACFRVCTMQQLRPVVG